MLPAAHARGGGHSAYAPFALAAALLLLCRTRVTVRAADDDGPLLLDFKRSFANGDALLEDWRAGTSPCGWQGVGCNSNGDVAIM